MRDVSREKSKRPVVEMIQASLPNTLVLAGLALVVTVAVGVPLGVLAARYRGSLLDQSIRILGVAGHAIPAFWFGLLWVALCGLFVVATLGIGLLIVWAPFGVVGLWFIYRIARGWIQLKDRRPMYG